MHAKRSSNGAFIRTALICSTMRLHLIGGVGSSLAIGDHLSIQPHPWHSMASIAMMMVMMIMIIIIINTNITPTNNSMKMRNITTIVISRRGRGRAHFPDNQHSLPLGDKYHFKSLLIIIMIGRLPFGEDGTEISEGHARNVNPIVRRRGRRRRSLKP